MKKKSGLQRALKAIELGVRRSFLFILDRSRSPRQPGTADIEPRLRKLLAASPRILFLRQDRLGDAIITTPLLVAVHEAYPNAHIMMLLGANNEAIKPLLPVDCETVVYRKHFGETLKLIRSLRSLKIDVLIDLTDNASVTSSLLIRGMNPKVAIGIEKENSVIYDIVVLRLDRETTHITRRIAELLRPLDIDPDTVSLAPILSFDPLPKVRGRLGINVSAGSSSRYAPKSTYSAIAHALGNEIDISEVCILNDPSDMEFAADIARMAANPKVHAMPRAMSFSEFGAFLGSCDILITPDTSVVHLGAAAGVPMVVIYAPIPDGLHYWTPVGVPFEMMVQRPSLETLEPEPVLALFRTLKMRISAQTQQDR